MTHAIQLQSPGDADALEWVGVADPDPGPDDCLVEIHAAGVNFIDTYHRSGLYSVPMPFVPGAEGSGVVAAVGDNVTAFKPGDRVAWAGGGRSYATSAALASSALLPVPDAIGLDIVAALPLQGMTAHYLVSSTYPLTATDRCVIHAAAGGTGRLMVQMAKIRGAEVVATVGTDEKADLARSAGADHVINYTTTDLVAGIEAAVGANAIDVVYDGVGASTFEAGLAVLRVRGTMATFGNASGPVPAISPLTLMPKSLFLTRPKLGDYIADPAERADRWQELSDWVISGRLDVRIGHTFPMAEAARAHVALESRATTGKILLTN